ISCGLLGERMGGMVRADEIDHARGRGRLRGGDVGFAPQWRKHLGVGPEPRERGRIEVQVVRRNLDEDAGGRPRLLRPRDLAAAPIPKPRAVETCRAMTPAPVAWRASISRARPSASLIAGLLSAKAGKSVRPALRRRSSVASITVWSPAYTPTRAPSTAACASMSRRSAAST